MESKMPICLRFEKLLNEPQNSDSGRQLDENRNKDEKRQPYLPSEFILEIKNVEKIEDKKIRDENNFEYFLFEELDFATLLNMEQRLNRILLPLTSEEASNSKIVTVKLDDPSQQVLQNDAAFLALLIKKYVLGIPNTKITVMSKESVLVPADKENLVMIFDSAKSGISIKLRSDISPSLKDTLTDKGVRFFDLLESDEIMKYINETKTGFKDLYICDFNMQKKQINPASVDNAKQILTLLKQKYPESIKGLLVEKPYVGQTPEQQSKSIGDIIVDASYNSFDAQYDSFAIQLLRELIATSTNLKDIRTIMLGNFSSEEFKDFKRIIPHKNQNITFQAYYSFMNSEVAKRIDEVKIVRDKNAEILSHMASGSDKESSNDLDVQRQLLCDSVLDELDEKQLNKVELEVEKDLPMFSIFANQFYKNESPAIYISPSTYFNCLMCIYNDPSILDTREYSADYATLIIPFKDLQHIKQLVREYLTHQEKLSEKLKNKLQLLELKPESLMQKKAELMKYPELLKNYPELLCKLCKQDPTLLTDELRNNKLFQKLLNTSIERAVNFLRNNDDLFNNLICHVVAPELDSFDRDSKECLRFKYLQLDSQMFYLTSERIEHCLKIIQDKLFAGKRYKVIETDSIFEDMRTMGTRVVEGRIKKFMPGVERIFTNAIQNAEKESSNEIFSREQAVEAETQKKKKAVEVKIQREVKKVIKEIIQKTIAASEVPEVSSENCMVPVDSDSLQSSADKTIENAPLEPVTQALDERHLELGTQDFDKKAVALVADDNLQSPSGQAVENIPLEATIQVSDPLPQPQEQLQWKDQSQWRKVDLAAIFSSNNEVTKAPTSAVEVPTITHINSIDNSEPSVDAAKCDSKVQNQNCSTDNVVASEPPSSVTTISEDVPGVQAPEVADYSNPNTMEQNVAFVDNLDGNYTTNDALDANRLRDYNEGWWSGYRSNVNHEVCYVPYYVPYYVQPLFLPNVPFVYPNAIPVPSVPAPYCVKPPFLANIPSQAPDLNSHNLKLNGKSNAVLHDSPGDTLKR